MDYDFKYNTLVKNISTVDMPFSLKVLTTSMLALGLNSFDLNNRFSKSVLDTKRDWLTDRSYQFRAGYKNPSFLLMGLVNRIK